jgi:diguanylate cyclase (GGDEF)-like protein
VIRLATDDALPIAASTEHLPIEYVNTFWSVTTDNPAHPSAEVMRSAAPVVVPDVSKRANEWGRIVGRAGFRSNCTYPLMSGNGRLWGTMEVYRTYVGSADFHPTTLVEAAHLATLTVEHRRFTEQLAYQAHHDALTGLPNRLVFEQRLEEMLTLAREHSQSVAVLFLDVDNFKQVNDSLGHLTGDELLRQIASRLRHVVRAPDTLARVGGDEFTIITRRLHTPEDEQAIALAILQCFHQPFAIHGQEVQAGASVGISVFPRDATSLPHLVRRADAAMYEAKVTGKNSWRSSASGKTAAKLQPMSLLADLELALGRNEFNLVYQPQISLDTGDLFGFEALLRWRHPVLGPVSPKFFIPIAEESGLIVRIGKWVAEQACLQLSEWRKAGLPTRVAINVSAVQFGRRAWPDEVRDILLRTGLPPDCLELELTETAMMKDVDQAIACMDRFREMGVALSIDDFGAGYSSLAYLKRFRVDRLKLDPAFVSGMKGGSTQALLVGAVTGLAHSLGINVVAEGVETKGQLALLRQLNCDEAQGFYIGRPMSAADAIIRLRQSAFSTNGTDREAGSRLPDKPARSR